jgi:myo-inositol 2-dehydrogenase/D-chiro-inositol 1-dehydrogenase
LGGRVGRVRAAHCVHRNARSHPSHTDDSVLSNSMVHELDCVPWLLDDPLAAVTVFAAQVPDGQLHDLQVAVLETASGCVVTVEVYVNAGYGYDIRTEVVGTAGTVSLAPTPGGFSSGAVEHFREAYRREVAAWVEGIRAGVLPGPTAWDGHRASVAAFAAVESLHGAGRVMIPAEERPRLYD